MKISVIIPTFNREEFISRAINSIQNQSYKIDEIIIIDDGSTDNTKELIEKNYPNVIYKYQENSGVSSARNLGIKLSKNDWVAFLDSDDEWHTNKIQSQISFHNENSYKISYTNEIWQRQNKIIKKNKSQQKPYGDCFLQNLSFCKIGPSTVLIHKSIFEDIGVFDTTLKVCEDYDLWLRILAKYPIGLIDEELITKYAGGYAQLSFDTPNHAQYQIVALKKHLTSKYKDEIQKEILKKEKI